MDFKEFTQEYIVPQWWVLSIAAIGGGFAGHSCVSDYSVNYKIAFSERGQIAKIVHAQGKKMNPITKVLTGAWEFENKVAYADLNARRSRGDSLEALGNELGNLEYRPSFNVHYPLSQYAGKIGFNTECALSTIPQLIAAKKDMRPINHHLDEAWKDTHRDKTHTETYSCTKTRTAYNGKTESYTDTCTKTVYDYTDHVYYFDRAESEVALNLLNDFQKKYPDLHVYQELVVANTTGADNEDAMQKSRPDEYRNRNISPAEALKLAREWAASSTLAVNMPHIDAAHKELFGLNRSLQGTLSSTEARYHNRTYSEYDKTDHNPPPQFVKNERALNDGVTVQELSAEIVDGLAFAGQSIPRQFHLAKLLMDRKAPAPEAAREQLKSEMEKTMAMNFKRHDFVDNHLGEKIGYTALGAMTAALVVGSAIGFGFLRPRRQQLLKAYDPY